ncbi:hypothetical protein DSO57_1006575 [Entomophthora muscae]|uniref:Uncharacterized protein n=1 Tax=Entomophthora muscae TaxID=34485 RepID=A0ACC2TVA9_9FUNG|nr:hypothetical protein DSO57_1006575 [Entomophthora muscae]
MPPMEWLFLSQKSYFFDSLQKKCVEKQISTMSTCAAFPSKNQCESTCLYPKFVPLYSAHRKTYISLETRQQILYCNPLDGGTCNLLHWKYPKCSCERKPRPNMPNYILSDPHVKEI